MSSKSIEERLQSPEIQCREIQPFPYLDTTEPGVHRESRWPGIAVANSPETHGNQQAVQVARQEGRKEGEMQARAEFEKHVAAIRDEVRAALAGFAQERARYYQQVEGEVVRLALSVARKILHREAQIDPLLLAGLVRVALEKIAAGTKVSLRVSPQQVSEYRGYFARHLEPHEVPEVVEDPELETDRCVLQTSLGATDLGLDIQLKEIEHGLLDLMAHQPKNTE